MLDVKRRTAENLAMARASLQEAEEEAAQERLERCASASRSRRKLLDAERRASGRKEKRGPVTRPTTRLVCQQPRLHDLKKGQDLQCKRSRSG